MWGLLITHYHTNCTTPLAVLQEWSVTNFCEPPEKGPGRQMSVFISDSLWSVCWIVLDCLLSPKGHRRQVQITGEELQKKQPPGDALQGHSCLPAVDLPLWRGTRDYRFISHSRLASDWHSSFERDCCDPIGVCLQKGPTVVPSHSMRHMAAGVQWSVWNHCGNKLHRIWKYPVNMDRWCICTSFGEGSPA